MQSPLLILFLFLALYEFPTHSLPSKIIQNFRSVFEAATLMCRQIWVYISGEIKKLVLARKLPEKNQ